MNPTTTRLNQSPATLALVCVIGTLLVLISPVVSAFTPAYRASNVYSPARKLSPDVRRVLVLPLTGSGSHEQTENSQMLYDVLAAELNGTKKFEVIRATPAQLKACTGRTSWQAEEALPESLLDALGKRFACNGVLFCHVTSFRAYAPLAIGWRLKLVDARDGAIIWAVDEVFDAGQPQVQAGAKSYDRQRQKSGADDDGWITLHSPRRFGQYSAATLFEQLPER